MAKSHSYFKSCTCCLLIGLLVTPLSHSFEECLGKRSFVAGHHHLAFEGSVGCSTNRALGYAIGKQFAENIVSRIAQILEGGRQKQLLVRLEVEVQQKRQMSVCVLLRDVILYIIAYPGRYQAGGRVGRGS